MQDQRPQDPTPYLRRRAPLGLILGTFFAVTLPMVAANRFLPPREFRLLLVGYFWLLAYTHFLLTLCIYLESSNLRYFADGWRNRITYFVVPAGLMIFFAGYSGLGLASLQMGGAVTLAMIVGPLFRLADFNHFASQGFGVLQLLKAAGPGTLPRWLPRAERVFFGALTLLLWTGYLCADSLPVVDPGAPVLARAAAGACLAAALGALCAWGAGLASAWRTSPSADGLWQPLVYLGVQTASAGIALASPPLYVICLAIHYVEYHVVMAPRCFESRLDESSALDRFWGRLRRDKRVFYAGLLLLSALMVLAPAVRASPAYPALLEASGGLSWVSIFFLFDGLQAMHYFVEGRIWRLSDPHYRERLAPLYFRREPDPAGSAIRGAPSQA